MRYVLQRIAQAIVVVLFTYTAVFVFVSIIPSDVIQSTFNGETQLSQETIEQLERYYGLDRPLYEQYLSQLTNLLHGNFGYSINTGQPVTERIGSVIGYTLQLASLALAGAILISLTLLAAWTAAESPRIRDAVRAVPEVCASIPVFVIGVLGIQIFSFQLGWISLFSDGSLASTIFPAIVLAIPVSAPLSQVLLQGAERAQGEPYVQTARAKGLRPGRVLRLHVLKNISGPYLTVLGLNIGALFAGSVVTETVFGRTGLGSILLDALVTQDVQLIQGLVLITSVTVVVVNLVVDLVYVFLDPRVTLERGSRARRSRGSLAPAPIGAG